jgi:hypothetical protein
MKITKALMLEALRTEPLLAQGAFVQFDDLPWDEIQDAPASAPCRVCAVATVIRAHLPKTATLEELHDRAVLSTVDGPIRAYQLDQDGTSLVDLQEGGFWMNVLSCVFESDVPDPRQTAIEYVEKFFPEEIEI